MKYSKKIVIAAISAVLAIWIVETILLLMGLDGYPNIFITAWFSFWAVELAALAGIKITETKFPDIPDDMDEDDEDAVG